MGPLLSVPFLVMFINDQLSFMIRPLFMETENTTLIDVTGIKDANLLTEAIPAFHKAKIERIMQTKIVYICYS